MVDLYCERLGPGLLGEPLNALSNLAFVLAALAALHLARERGRREGRLLAALLGAIGLGSAAFHTFASAWAEWLDVLPIVAFQLALLGCYLRRLCGIGPTAVAIALGAFTLALALAASRPDLANGSLGYLPAALVLAALGFDHWRAEGSARLAAAAALFALSLTARSVDNAWCPTWPWGTHWIWHLLNAVVLYAVLSAYLTSRRQPPQPAARRPLALA